MLTQIPKFIESILEILQAAINPKNDIELRIDVLVLVEYIATLSPIHSQVKEYSVRIMKNILIPSITWKVGSPETKIRKAGILNMATMIDNQLLLPEGILECYKELLPPLKNCLTDDREPDLRKVSLSLVESILLNTLYELSNIGK